ncbi:hypothetical protein CBOM_05688 [Ceraceosorus bombacis]|uniref:Uncharacterized protein n=1 Tax=Ceraceosorus bombacis TaxID=401625 RepID=A0A0P1BQS9_9BASI|nr:hypothetical protein CBOM_05688 [Ceraceosorus bombacis]
MQQARALPAKDAVLEDLDTLHLQTGEAICSGRKEEEEMIATLERFLSSAGIQVPSRSTSFRFEDVRKHHLALSRILGGRYVELSVAIVSQRKTSNRSASASASPSSARLAVPIWDFEKGLASVKFHKDMQA